jgi:hypothetical protein
VPDPVLDESPEVLPVLLPLRFDDPVLPVEPVEPVDPVEPVEPVALEPRFEEPLFIEPEPVDEPMPPDEPETEPEPVVLSVLRSRVVFEVVPCVVLSPVAPRPIEPLPVEPLPLPVAPLMPLLPDPVPLDPPLEPPLDCAYAKPNVARNTAAARPVPIFLPAVIGTLLGVNTIFANAKNESRYSPKEKRWCRRKSLI